MSSTYSIWVEPKGEIASALQQEISYLANAYGGPIFPPHMTLVGGITGSEEHALKLATEISTQLKPYRVTFAKPDHGTMYHQCVYLLCERDEATMDAGKRSKLIGGQGDPQYMPHLSLLYADIDEHVRKEAVEVTKTRWKRDSRLEEGGFEVSSLHLYQTDPNDKSCKSWRRVEELSFHHS